jgi:HEPN domain-containing protein
MSKFTVDVEYITKNCIRNIRDYHKVSHDRWNNAMTCYMNEDYYTALYIAGYSVECILKYVLLGSLFSEHKTLSIRQVAKNGRKCLDSHHLRNLMRLGNEEKIFSVPKDSDYQLVIEWDPQWRYAIKHNINKEVAEEYLRSVVTLSEQLKKEMVGKIKIKEFKLSS